ncbi:MAG: TerC family protein [Pseudomonadota bacterium]|nr:TerC family protein [Pseudomonadota bacterium]
MTAWLSSIDWSTWYAWMFTLDGWVSLITLTFLEIVLGIDNLVFLTIASQRLPKKKRARAQQIGLSGALILRIAMLATLVWLTKLKTVITDINGFELTWSDVIFVFGGAFLLWKGTTEIHQEVEGGTEGPLQPHATSFAGVIAMIMVIDFVFALDSIITAVGLSQFLPVMIAANVAAILVMLLAAKPVGTFIEQHPTIKMLALAFILLVGLALIAEGIHIHIPRGFIYFAIAFSLTVEFLNILVRRKQKKPSATPATLAGSPGHRKKQD